MTILAKLLARLKPKAKPELIRRNRIAHPPDGAFHESYTVPGSRKILSRDVRERD